MRYRFVVAKSELNTVVARTLHSVLTRYKADQLFLFGPEGEPFWVAREPVTQAEMRVFENALDLLAKLETLNEKPFAAHAPDGSYSVAALAGDSDLFIVLIDRDVHPQAEARVALVRDALLPALGHLRTAAIRAQTLG